MSDLASDITGRVNQYLGDTITIDESDESMESMFADYQKIDGEIIDYGVFEDEYGQSQIPSQVSPKLPSNVFNEDKTRQLSSTQTSEGPAFISDTFNITKFLCVKVVDCIKYPWYYRKYKKPILRFQHHTEQRLVESNRDADMRNVDNLSTSNTGETSAPIYKVSGDDSVVKEKSNKTTSTIRNLNNTDEKKVKYKNKNNIQKRSKRTKDISFKNSTKSSHTSHQSPIIDYKKNTGLIGIKIQMMKCDNNLQETPKIKMTRTKRQVNSTNEIEHHNNKTNLGFGRKTDNTKTMISNFDIAKKNDIIVITENQHNQHRNVMSPQPGNAQKRSLKCSLKMPSEKVIKCIKEREKTSYRDEYKDFQNVGHKNIIAQIGNKQKYEDIVLDTEQNEAAVTSHNTENKLKERSNETIKHAKIDICHKPRPKSKKNEVSNVKTNYKEIVNKNKQKIENKPTESCTLNSSYVNIILKKSFPGKDYIANENLQPQSANDYSSARNLKVPNTNLLNNEKPLRNAKRTSLMLSNMLSVNDNRFKNINDSTKATLSELKEPNSENIDLTLISDVPVLKSDKYSDFISNSDVSIDSSHSMKNNVQNGFASVDLKLNKHSEDANTKLSAQCNVFAPSYFNTTLSEQLRVMQELNSSTSISSVTQPLSVQKTTEPQFQMKSRRKQPLKIRCYKNIGNIENYMYMNGITKAIVQSIVTKPTITSPEPCQNISRNIVNFGKCMNNDININSIVARNDSRSQYNLFKQDICQKVKTDKNYANVKFNIQPTTTQPKLVPFLNKSLEPSEALSNNLPVQAILAGNQQDYNIISENVPHVIPTSTMDSCKRKTSQTPVLLLKNTNDGIEPKALDSLQPTYVKNFGQNMLKNHIAKPPFSRLPQSIKEQTAMKQIRSETFVHGHAQNQVNPTQEHRQGFVDNNACPNINFRGNNYVQDTLMQDNNMQNNYKQRFDNIPNTGHISHAGVLNTSMSPRISDVPLNVYRPYTTILPAPLLPPPPPPSPYVDNLSSFVESSIIGRNNDGFIKKINISSPLTNQESKKHTVVQLRNDNERYTLSEHVAFTEKSIELPLVSDTLVSPRTEIIKNPDNLFPNVNPMNTNLRIPNADRSPSTNSLIEVKRYKPGPLSKKRKDNKILKLNKEHTKAKLASCNADHSHKQYSPPILPIPTYQTVLSEVRTPVPPKPGFKTIIPEVQTPNLEDERKPPSLNTKVRPDKNTFQKASSKKSLSTGITREDSPKKISVEEYKKRNYLIENRQQTKGQITAKSRISTNCTLSTKYNNKSHDLSSL